MDERFLVSIEYIGNGCKVIALEETVANAKAFQPFIAVELLIVVVVDSRLKHRLVFGTHHRNGIASEIRACHGEYVSRGLVEKSANECTETVIFISRTVVKLVDAEEYVIEFSCIYAIERVKERGMGADELCRCWMVKKF